MRYVLWVFLFFSVVLEGMFTIVPLIISALILLYIYTRSHRILYAAFICGIVIDIMQLFPLGQSSIYYLFVVLLASLYERKFEIATAPFVFISVFLGGIGYLILVGSTGFLYEALVNAVIAVVLFGISSKFLISNS